MCFSRDAGAHEGRAVGAEGAVGVAIVRQREHEAVPPARRHADHAPPVRAPCTTPGAILLTPDPHRADAGTRVSFTPISSTPTRGPTSHGSCCACHAVMPRYLLEGVTALDAGVE